MGRMTVCSSGWEFMEGESVFKGISTNTNHAELKIKNIEISHQRSRTPSEKLTESELVIFRAEIENYCGWRGWRGRI